MLAGILFFLLEMSARFVYIHSWSGEQPPAGYWSFLGYYALAGSALGIGTMLVGRAATRWRKSTRLAILGIAAAVCAVAVTMALLTRAVVRLGLSSRKILLDFGTVLLAAAIFAAIGWALDRLRRRYGSAHVLVACGACFAMLIGGHAIFLHTATLGQILARLPDSAAGPAKPNVLLLTVDTLRADRLGAYGYHRNTSENIDRLAAEGALFQRAVAHSPWTRPSFGSIMTSRYPSQHGAFAVFGEDSSEQPLYDGGLRREAVTMAEILSDHGYTTVAFQTNLRASRAHGFDRGFHAFIYESLFIPPIQERSVLGSLVRWAQLFLGIQPKAFLYGFPPNADKVHALFESLSPHLPQPFFIWMNLMDPHSPYVSRDRDTPIAEAGITGVHHALNADISTTVLSDAYDDEIRFMDHHAGKMLDLLRSRGLLDNTIVILTSDHGEEFDDHGVEIHHPSTTIRGRYHGHSLYSELLHVPLIIRFPRQIPQGLRIEALARHVDILPTILDLVAIEPRDPGEPFEGASLLPLMLGKATPRRLAYGERKLYGPPQHSIQDDRYKLIFEVRSGRLELYDLDADPGEIRNLAAARQDETDRLLASLEAWTARMGPALPPSPAIPLEPTEDLDSLRSLGYVE